QSSGLNPRKTANSAHFVSPISACNSYGFAIFSLCAWKLSERSPGPCRSGVTIWLKPLVVAKDNGALETITTIAMSATNSIRSSSCLVAIRDRLAELIREHEPDCCALESVIYVQSYKTAIVLGAARGAAILAAAENGLPIFEYAPNRIKQATVGTGAAGKSQVAFMVRALLGLTETPDADAADALAIGLTHLRSQEAARFGVPSGAQI